MHYRYAEMEATAGWKDYKARLISMRQSLINEILVGTLDKFGNAHEDSKRAALMVCERALMLTDAVHKQYTDLSKRRDEMHERAQRRDSVHANDTLSFHFDDV